MRRKSFFLMVVVLLVSVTTAASTYPEILLSEDFESGNDGNSIAEVTGWSIGGGEMKVTSNTSLTGLAVEGSQSASGTMSWVSKSTSAPSSGAKYYALTSKAYVDSSTVNSGIFLGTAASGEYCGVWYAISGWVFDARGLSGDSGDILPLGTTADGRGENVDVTITFDLDANTVTGTLEYSGGTLSLTYGYTPGAEDSITRVVILQDLRSYSSGVDIDDIYVSEMFVSEAGNPSPADIATNVAINQDLSWAAGTHANDVNGHDVYFGTSFSDVNTATTASGVYMGVQSSTTYDTGTMDSNATYYWRIDEINDSNSNSPWTGDIWSFSTVVLYDEASSPSPVDSATGVWFHSVLSWTAGVFAGDVNGHNVYFGTGQTSVTNASVGDPMGVYQGRQSETSFDPCGLEADTIYYWRVDEVNESDPNMWVGDVWSFTTVDVIAILELGGSLIVDVTSGDVEYGCDPCNTINGSGLAGDLHGTNYNHMWIGSLSPLHESYNAGTVSGENWIAYEFDKPYSLEKMWVWNYNDGSIATAWQCSLKDVTIQYSVTGGTDFGEWQTLGGAGVRQQFAPAGGLGDYAHNTEIDFDSARARYVVITPDYGEGYGWWGPLAWNLVGLSEVRFHYLAHLDEAIYPEPAEGSIGVRANMYLSWTGSDYASSHDVYVGTNFDDVNNAVRLAGDADGDGAGDVNDVGVIAAWWLTDANGSEPYADLNRDRIVNFGDFRIVADDYGKSGEAVFKGNQSETRYSVASLDSNSSYYWRVDERRKSSRVKGSMWSFSTAPVEAWNRRPEDGGVSARILSWAPGFYAGDANGHDVYVGTSYNDVNGATTASVEHAERLSRSYYDVTSYDDFNGLTPGQTYYWRVDEVNDSIGVPFKGEVRSFLHTKRRVIHNDDGAGSWWYAGGLNVNKDFDQDVWLSNVVDSVVDTHVDTILWCDGDEGATARYNSDVAEHYGAYVGNEDADLVAMYAAGDDSPELVVSRAHSLGMEIFYSYRINGNDYIEESMGQIRADNPDWLLDPNWDGMWGTLSPYGYKAQFNFAVEGVRDYKYAMIEEIATKYDFDGIEIDFMRAVPFFLAGTEPSNAYILTNFLGRVRTRLNEISAARGRKFLVAVRVDESIEICDLDGLDVNSWVENDLIDILIMGSGVIDINVADFTAITAGTDVPVYPCLYGYPSNYRSMTENMVYGLATNYWYQGADGIYLFNWSPFSKPDWDVEKLTTIGNPNDLIVKDKMYPAERNYDPPQFHYPHNWLNVLLPELITSGQTIEVPLLVGEDIDGTYSPTSIQLRVGFDGDLDGGDSFVIGLNGNTLTQVRGSGEITMTPLVSQVLVGYNTVSIQITGGAATVNAVELHVNY